MKKKRLLKPVFGIIMAAVLAVAIPLMSSCAAPAPPAAPPAVPNHGLTYGVLCE